MLKFTLNLNYCLNFNITVKNNVKLFCKNDYQRRRDLFGIRPEHTKGKMRKNARGNYFCSGYFFAVRFEGKSGLIVNEEIIYFIIISRAPWQYN